MPEKLNTNRMNLPLSSADPEIAAAIDHEVLRQHEGLEVSEWQRRTIKTNRPSRPPLFYG